MPRGHRSLRNSPHVRFVQKTVTPRFTDNMAHSEVARAMIEGLCGDDLSPFVSLPGLGTSPSLDPGVRGFFLIGNRDPAPYPAMREPLVEKMCESRLADSTQ